MDTQGAEMPAHFEEPAVLMEVHTAEGEAIGFLKWTDDLRVDDHSTEITANPRVRQGRREPRLLAEFPRGRQCT